MYNPQHILDVLSANIRGTRNPFGLSGKTVNTWWKGAGLPRHGQYFLFTGLMYQLMPSIQTASSYLAKWEDNAAVHKVLPYARYLPKSMESLGLNALTPNVEKERANALIRSMVRLLQKSGLDVAYQPELDFYSGILLYDLGDVEAFVNHARMVAQRLREANISKIITLDPHTTYAMKVLYPYYLDESFQVSTYLEHLFLNGKGVSTRDGTVVIIHDPCFYGRYLDLSAQPRRILQEVGVAYEDVPFTSRYTHCCGGPAESIAPSLAHTVRDKRLAEIGTTDQTIVTMCPICYANLRKSGARVQDIATVISEHVDEAL